MTPRREDRNLKGLKGSSGDLESRVGGTLIINKII